MRDFEANSALVEEERAKKLRELERKQKAVSAEADECEQSITQVSKIIDQLRTGTNILVAQFYSYDMWRMHEDEPIQVTHYSISFYCCAAGIDSLFSKLECDRSTIEEMLGPQDVNEDNMLQFLGVIEQKTNDLLITRAYLDYTFQKARVHELCMRFKRLIHDHCSHRRRSATTRRRTGCSLRFRLLRSSELSCRLHSGRQMQI